MTEDNRSWTEVIGSGNPEAHGFGLPPANVLPFRSAPGDPDLYAAMKARQEPDMPMPSDPAMRAIWLAGYTAALKHIAALIEEALAAKRE